MSLTSTCLESGETVITSGNSLTIETASEFMRLLREGLETSRNVSVELEPAVEIDLTGLQLFCSACKTAAAQNKTLTYHGPRPQALEDIIEACGAGRHAVCKQNMDSNCLWFGGAQ
jgi:anti-anti-sigma regulatory factor